MLKKLLRYDLKSVFKYWWIAALTSVGISFFGGTCLAAITSEQNNPSVLTALSGIGIFVAIMGLSAFMLTSTILIFIRFYKNFFTDEGYLTFTLPVRRSQLINSKLIMSIVLGFATSTVFLIDILILTLIGVGDKIGLEDISYMMTEFADIMNFKVALYMCIYILEFLLFILLSAIASTLFLFGCITFASIITKKAKVITAIGIYYVATSVVSSVVQFLYLFVIGALSDWFASIPNDMYAPIIAVIALIIIAFMAVVCLLLYLLMYWMLDRKLNLA